MVALTGMKPSVNEHLTLCETGPPVTIEGSTTLPPQPVYEAILYSFTHALLCTLQKLHRMWQLFIPIPHNRNDGEGKKVTNDVRLSCDKGFHDHIQIQPAWQTLNPHGHPGRDLHPLIFSLSQADGFESNSSWLLGFVTKLAYKYMVLNKTASQKHTPIAAKMSRAAILFRHRSNVALKKKPAG